MPEREVAHQLAAAHRQADPTTTTVKYFPSHAVVRLLEVSASAPTTGEILPFQFDADRANGIDYPSVVILLSPAEWARVNSGSLALPAGWALDQAEDL
jgi:hypothetical protein